VKIQAILQQVLPFQTEEVRLIGADELLDAHNPTTPRSNSATLFLAVSGRRGHLLVNAMMHLVPFSSGLIPSPTTVSRHNHLRHDTNHFAERITACTHPPHN
jgi:hypothetical protein